MAIKFGEVLRSIRERNKWTLEEMAAYLDTTKQVLSKYERGERTPKITMAAQFAEKLGLPLEELVGSEDTGKQAPRRMYATDAMPAALQEQEKNDIRVLIPGIDKLSKDQREQIVGIFRAVFEATYSNMEKGSDDNDA